MIKLSSLLQELSPKNTWLKVNTSQYGDDLISLVQTAYKKSPLGSFINTRKDLGGSDWQGIDIDDIPDVDATIFYRNPRAGETWRGHKIQGIGHDGSRQAIDVVLNRMKKLLNEPGYWVEASDALEHVLYKMGVPYVKDEKTAQLVFPKGELKMTGNRGEYVRQANGTKYKETIFGNPKV